MGAAEIGGWRGARWGWIWSAVSSLREREAREKWVGDSMTMTTGREGSVEVEEWSKWWALIRVVEGESAVGNCKYRCSAQPYDLTGNKCIVARVEAWGIAAGAME